MATRTDATVMVVGVCLWFHCGIRKRVMLTGLAAGIKANVIATLMSSDSIECSRLHHDGLE